MLGVPALARWLSGPSERTVLPTPKLRISAACSPTRNQLSKAASRRAGVWLLTPEGEPVHLTLELEEAW